MRASRCIFSYYYIYDIYYNVWYFNFVKVKISESGKMAVRYVGAEPSSPCAQLEHIADLLRNRVNSQQNPSLYEVWRPKL